jgi:glycosyltransferase involved in cell wall biosynthesis
MKTIKVTVILCTYDRCNSLVNALNSAAALTLPGSVECEILVVDNNSHDLTCEVVERFCQRYPGRFRYLFEPKAGKSHALNAGIREARGEVLAFMDDDVTVEPTWLQNLTAALYDGEWAGAGGRVLAAWSFSPPSWLSLEGPYEIGTALALFDLGPEAGPLTQSPIGTNMAFRREVFEKYGCFRTDLGPSPGSEIRGEDTEFGRRLIAAGERLRYEPCAVVYHGVPECRLKKDYFKAFWFDHGRASVREVGARSDIWGIRRQYFSVVKMGFLLVVWTLRWLLTIRTQQRRFYYKLWVWMTAGVIVEFYRQLQESRADPLHMSDRKGCSAQDLTSEIHQR